MCVWKPDQKQKRKRLPKFLPVIVVRTWAPPPEPMPVKPMVGGKENYLPHSPAG